VAEPVQACSPSFHPSWLSQPGLAAGARVPGVHHPANAAGRPPERWPGPTSCGSRQCPDGPRTLLLPKPRPRTSSGMLVLVENAAEAVASSYVEVGHLVGISDPFGQRVQGSGIREALMRPVSVLELLELAQGAEQMPVGCQYSAEPATWHSISLFDRLESLIRTRSGTVSIHLNAFICGRPSLGGHGKMPRCRSPRGCILMAGDTQVVALAEYWHPTGLDPPRTLVVEPQHRCRRPGVSIVAGGPSGNHCVGYGHDGP
jgi:hypothetical protein